MKKRKNNIPLIIRIMRAIFPWLETYVPFLSDRLFRLVFYVPVTYPLPEKEREAEKSGQEFSLVVGAKTIRGHRWGDPGRPYVLFVHGWAGRATQFRRFIKPLRAAGFQVIGPDGPAHGRSDGFKTSILEFEDMFHALFSKFGQPAGIITHSFGGAAVLYAGMNGLAIGTLVNIASPSLTDEILKTYLRAINGSWKSAERFKRFVVQEAGKSFDEFTALHAVSKLQHPVRLLLIDDEDDKEVITMHADALLKVYPTAILFRTSGLGHNRILKDEKVIQKAIGFIRGNIPEPSASTMAGSLPAR